MSEARQERTAPADQRAAATRSPHPLEQAGDVRFGQSAPPSGQAVTSQAVTSQAYAGRAAESYREARPPKEMPPGTRGRDDLAALGRMANSMAAPGELAWLVPGGGVGYASAQLTADGRLVPATPVLPDGATLLPGGKLGSVASVLPDHVRHRVVPSIGLGGKTTDISIAGVRLVAGHRLANGMRRSATEIADEIVDSGFVPGMPLLLAMCDPADTGIGRRVGRLLGEHYGVGFVSALVTDRHVVSTKDKMLIATDVLSAGRGELVPVLDTDGRGTGTWSLTSAEAPDVEVLTSVAQEAVLGNRVPSRPREAVTVWMDEAHQPQPITVGEVRFWPRYGSGGALEVLQLEPDARREELDAWQRATRPTARHRNRMARMAWVPELVGSVDVPYSAPVFVAVTVRADGLLEDASGRGTEMNDLGAALADFPEPVNEFVVVLSGSTVDDPVGEARGIWHRLTESARTAETGLRIQVVSRGASFGGNGELHLPALSSIWFRRAEDPLSKPGWSVVRTSTDLALYRVVHNRTLVALASCSAALKQLDGRWLTLLADRIPMFREGDRERWSPWPSEVIESRVLVPLSAPADTRTTRVWVERMSSARGEWIAPHQWLTELLDGGNLAEFVGDHTKVLLWLAGFNLTDETSVEVAEPMLRVMRDRGLDAVVALPARMRVQRFNRANCTYAVVDTMENLHILRLGADDGVERVTPPPPVKKRNMSWPVPAGAAAGSSPQVFTAVSQAFWLMTELGPVRFDTGTGQTLFVRHGKKMIERNEHIAIRVENTGVVLRAPVLHPMFEELKVIGGMRFEVLKDGQISVLEASDVVRSMVAADAATRVSQRMDFVLMLTGGAGGLPVEEAREVWDRLSSEFTRDGGRGNVHVVSSGARFGRQGELVLPANAAIWSTDNPLDKVWLRHDIVSAGGMAVHRYTSRRRLLALATSMGTEARFTAIFSEVLANMMPGLVVREGNPGLNPPQVRPWWHADGENRRPVALLAEHQPAGDTVLVEDLEQGERRWVSTSDWIEILTRGSSMLDLTSGIRNLSVVAFGFDIDSEARARGVGTPMLLMFQRSGFDVVLYLMALRTPSATVRELGQYFRLHGTTGVYRLRFGADGTVEISGPAELAGELKPKSGKSDAVRWTYSPRVYTAITPAYQKLIPEGAAERSADVAAVVEVLGGSDDGGDPMEVDSEPTPGMVGRWRVRSATGEVRDAPWGAGDVLLIEAEPDDDGARLGAALLGQEASRALVVVRPRGLLMGRVEAEAMADTWQRNLVARRYFRHVWVVTGSATVDARDGVVEVTAGASLVGRRHVQPEMALLEKAQLRSDSRGAVVFPSGDRGDVLMRAAERLIDESGSDHAGPRQAMSGYWMVHEPLTAGVPALRSWVGLPNGARGLVWIVVHGRSGGFVGNVIDGDRNVPLSRQGFGAALREPLAGHLAGAGPQDPPRIGLYAGLPDLDSGDSHAEFFAGVGVMGCGPLGPVYLDPGTGQGDASFIVTGGFGLFSPDPDERMQEVPREIGTPQRFQPGTGIVPVQDAPTGPDPWQVHPLGGRAAAPSPPAADLLASTSLRRGIAMDDGDGFAAHVAAGLSEPNVVLSHIDDAGARVLDEVSLDGAFVVAVRRRGDGFVVTRSSRPREEVVLGLDEFVADLVRRPGVREHAAVAGRAPVVLLTPDGVSDVTLAAFQQALRRRGLRVPVAATTAPTRWTAGGVVEFAGPKAIHFRPVAPPAAAELAYRLLKDSRGRTTAIAMVSSRSWREDAPRWRALARTAAADYFRVAGSSKDGRSTAALTPLPVHGSWVFQLAHAAEGGFWGRTRRHGDVVVSPELLGEFLTLPKIQTALASVMAVDGTSRVTIGLGACTGDAAVQHRVFDTMFRRANASLTGAAPTEQDVGVHVGAGSTARLVIGAGGGFRIFERSAQSVPGSLPAPVRPAASSVTAGEITRLRDSRSAQRVQGADPARLPGTRPPGTGGGRGPGTNVATRPGHWARRRRNLASVFPHTSFRMIRGALAPPARRSYPAGRWSMRAADGGAASSWRGRAVVVEVRPGDDGGWLSAKVLGRDARRAVVLVLRGGVVLRPDAALALAGAVAQNLASRGFFREVRVVAGQAGVRAARREVVLGEGAVVVGVEAPQPSVELLEQRWLRSGSRDVLVFPSGRDGKLEGVARRLARTGGGLRGYWLVEGPVVPGVPVSRRWVPFPGGGDRRGEKLVLVHGAPGRYRGNVRGGDRHVSLGRLEFGRGVRRVLGPEPAAAGASGRAPLALLSCLPPGVPGDSHAEFFHGLGTAGYAPLGMSYADSDRGGRTELLAAGGFGFFSATPDVPVRVVAGRRQDVFEHRWATPSAHLVPLLGPPGRPIRSRTSVAPGNVRTRYSIDGRVVTLYFERMLAAAQERWTARGPREQLIGHRGHVLHEKVPWRTAVIALRVISDVDGFADMLINAGKELVRDGRPLEILFPGTDFGGFDRRDRAIATLRAALASKGHADALVWVLPPGTEPDEDGNVLLDLGARPLLYGRYPLPPDRIEVVQSPAGRLFRIFAGQGLSLLTTSEWMVRRVNTDRWHPALLAGLPRFNLRWTEAASAAGIIRKSVAAKLRPTPWAVNRARSIAVVDMSGASGRVTRSERAQAPGLQTLALRWKNLTDFGDFDELAGRYGDIAVVILCPEFADDRQLDEFGQMVQHSLRARGMVRHVHLVPLSASRVHIAPGARQSADHFSIRAEDWIVDVPPVSLTAADVFFTDVKGADGMVTSVVLPSAGMSALTGNEDVLSSSLSRGTYAETGRGLPDEVAGERHVVPWQAADRPAAPPAIVFDVDGSGSLFVSARSDSGARGDTVRVPDPAVVREVIWSAVLRLPRELWGEVVLFGTGVLTASVDGIAEMLSLRSGGMSWLVWLGGGNLRRLPDGSGEFVLTGGDGFAAGVAGRARPPSHVDIDGAGAGESGRLLLRPGGPPAGVVVLPTVELGGTVEPADGDGTPPGEDLPDATATSVLSAAHGPPTSQTLLLHADHSALPNAARMWLTRMHSRYSHLEVLGHHHVLTAPWSYQSAFVFDEVRGGAFVRPDGRGGFRPSLMEEVFPWLAEDGTAVPEDVVLTGARFADRLDEERFVARIQALHRRHELDVGVHVLPAGHELGDGVGVLPSTVVRSYPPKPSNVDSEYEVVFTASGHAQYRLLSRGVLVGLAPTRELATRFVSDNLGPFFASGAPSYQSPGDAEPRRTAWYRQDAEHRPILFVEARDGRMPLEDASASRRDWVEPRAWFDGMKGAELRRFAGRNGLDGFLFFGVNLEDGAADAVMAKLRLALHETGYSRSVNFLMDTITVPLFSRDVAFLVPETLDSWSASLPPPVAEAAEIAVRSERDEASGAMIVTLPSQALTELGGLDPSFAGGGSSIILVVAESAGGVVMSTTATDDGLFGDDVVEDPQFLTTVLAVQGVPLMSLTDPLVVVRSDGTGAETGVLDRVLSALDLATGQPWRGRVVTGRRAANPGPSPAEPRVTTVTTARFLAGTAPEQPTSIRRVERATNVRPVVVGAQDLTFYPLFRFYHSRWITYVVALNKGVLTRKLLPWAKNAGKKAIAELRVEGRDDYVVKLSTRGIYLVGAISEGKFLVGRNPDTTGMRWVAPQTVVGALMFNEYTKQRMRFSTDFLLAKVDLGGHERATRVLVPFLQAVMSETGRKSANSARNFTVHVLPRTALFHGSGDVILSRGSVLRQFRLARPPASPVSSYEITVTSDGFVHYRLLHRGGLVGLATSIEAAEEHVNARTTGLGEVAAAGFAALAAGSLGGKGLPWLAADVQRYPVLAPHLSAVGVDGVLEMVDHGTGEPSTVQLSEWLSKMVSTTDFRAMAGHDPRVPILITGMRFTGPDSWQTAKELVQPVLRRFGYRRRVVFAWDDRSAREDGQRASDPALTTYRIVEPEDFTTEQINLHVELSGADGSPQEAVGLLLVTRASQALRGAGRSLRHAVRIGTYVRHVGAMDAHSTEDSVHQASWREPLVLGGAVDTNGHLLGSLTVEGDAEIGDTVLVDPEMLAAKLRLLGETFAELVPAWRLSPERVRQLLIAAGRPGVGVSPEYMKRFVRALSRHLDDLAVTAHFANAEVDLWHNETSATFVVAEGGGFFTASAGQGEVQLEDRRAEEVRRGRADAGTGVLALRWTEPPRLYENVVLAISDEFDGYFQSVTGRSAIASGGNGLRNAGARALEAIERGVAPQRDGGDRESSAESSGGRETGAGTAEVAMPDADLESIPDLVQGSLVPEFSMDDLLDDSTGGEVSTDVFGGLGFGGPEVVEEPTPDGYVHRLGGHGAVVLIVQPGARSVALTTRLLLAAEAGTLMFDGERTAREVPWGRQPMLVPLDLPDDGGAAELGQVAERVVRQVLRVEPVAEVADVVLVTDGLASIPRSEAFASRILELLSEHGRRARVHQVPMRAQWQAEKGVLLASSDAAWTYAEEFSQWQGVLTVELKTADGRVVHHLWHNGVFLGMATDTTAMRKFLLTPGRVDAAADGLRMFMLTGHQSAWPSPWQRRRPDGRVLVFPVYGYDGRFDLTDKPTRRQSEASFAQWFDVLLQGNLPRLAAADGAVSLVVIGMDFSSSEVKLRFHDHVRAALAAHPRIASAHFLSRLVGFNPPLATQRHHSLSFTSEDHVLTVWNPLAAAGRTAVPAPSYGRGAMRSLSVPTPPGPEKAIEDTRTDGVLRTLWRDVASYPVLNSQRVRAIAFSAAEVTELWPHGKGVASSGGRFRIAVVVEPSGQTVVPFLARLVVKVGVNPGDRRRRFRMESWPSQRQEWFDAATFADVMWNSGASYGALRLRPAFTIAADTGDVLSTRRIVGELRAAFASLEGSPAVDLAVVPFAARIRPIDGATVIPAGGEVRVFGESSVRSYDHLRTSGGAMVYRHAVRGTSVVLSTSADKAAAVEHQNWPANIASGLKSMRHGERGATRATPWHDTHPDAGVVMLAAERRESDGLYRVDQENATTTWVPVDQWLTTLQEDGRLRELAGFDRSVALVFEGVLRPTRRTAEDAADPDTSTVLSWLRRHGYGRRTYFLPPRTSSHWRAGLGSMWLPKQSVIFSWPAPEPAPVELLLITQGLGDPVVLVPSTRTRDLPGLGHAVADAIARGRYVRRSGPLSTRSTAGDLVHQGRWATTGQGLLAVFGDGDGTGKVLGSWRVGDTDQMGDSFTVTPSFLTEALSAQGVLVPMSMQFSAEAFLGVSGVGAEGVSEFVRALWFETAGVEWLGHGPTTDLDVAFVGDTGGWLVVSGNGSFVVARSSDAVPPVLAAEDQPTEEIFPDPRGPASSLALTSAAPPAEDMWISAAPVDVPLSWRLPDGTMVRSPARLTPDGRLAPALAGVIGAELLGENNNNTPWSLPVPLTAIMRPESREVPMPSTASTVGVTMRLPVSNGLQIYRLRTGMEPRPSALDIAIDIFRQPGRIRGGLVAVIGPNAAEHAAEISRILGSHEFDNVGLTPVVVSRQDVVTTSDGLEIAVRRRHDPVAGWIDGVLDENGLGDGSWELYVGYHLPIGSSSVLQEVLTGVPTPAMRREIWQRWTSASNG